jgi:NAD(P)-dependent dehydrogenase (short-subunit alcohol dehydrogenase family)
MTRDVLVVIGVGGMGAAIARRLGAGHTVMLADYDETTTGALAASMTTEGYDIDCRRVDVSDRLSVSELARSAASHGRVSTLAHTAGVSPTSATPARILSVDLLGTALILDEFSAMIAPQGAGVVVASMAGTLLGAALGDETERQLATLPCEQLLDVPTVRSLLDADQEDAGMRGFAYALAKRANQLRVRAAAGQWGQRGARINSISPGVISTAMGRAEAADAATGEATSSLIAQSASKRMGTPTEIAAAAEFLLSANASFITGTDLLVDGGAVAATSAVLSPSTA